MRNKQKSGLLWLGDQQVINWWNLVDGKSCQLAAVVIGAADYASALGIYAGQGSIARVKCRKKFHRS